MLIEEKHTEVISGGQKDIMLKGQANQGQGIRHGVRRRGHFLQGLLSLMAIKTLDDTRTLVVTI